MQIKRWMKKYGKWGRKQKMMIYGITEDEKETEHILNKSNSAIIANDDE